MVLPKYEKANMEIKYNATGILNYKISLYSCKMTDSSGPGTCFILLLTSQGKGDNFQHTIFTSLER